VNRPELSVVLVTDRFATVRQVISRLRSHASRGRIEIVLVHPAGRSLEPEAGALEGFAAVRCVEVEAISPLGRARAKGIHAATAPLVVVGETHSFPREGWAEALIAAHAEPWAVVVPGFGNANPESALSWAAFLRDYGAWAECLSPAEIGFLPPYNTAIKRDVLLGFGDRLALMVSQGDELASDLRSRGHRVWFEPAARIDHANVSQVGPWIRQRYVVGRVIASSRAARWSGFRRMLYICGSPLVPFVILARLAGSVRRVRRDRRLPLGTLPALVLGTVLSALGEMVTYAVGAAGDDVILRCDEYELHKLRYTSLPAS
jgi:hypothetical protein